MVSKTLYEYTINVRGNFLIPKCNTPKHIGALISSPMSVWHHEPGMSLRDVNVGVLQHRSTYIGACTATVLRLKAHHAEC